MKRAEIENGKVYAVGHRGYGNKVPVRVIDASNVYADLGHSGQDGWVSDIHLSSDPVTREVEHRGTGQVVTKDVVTKPAREWLYYGNKAVGVHVMRLDHVTMEDRFETVVPSQRFQQTWVEYQAEQQRQFEQKREREEQTSRMLRRLDQAGVESQGYLRTYEVTLSYDEMHKVLDRLLGEDSDG